MSSTVNPLNQHRSTGLPEKAATIKLWTRENLPLTDEIGCVGQRIRLR